MVSLLGGKSDYLAIIGSWGDTLSDDELFEHLKSTNNAYDILNKTSKKSLS